MDLKDLLYKHYGNDQDRNYSFLISLLYDLRSIGVLDSANEVVDMLNEMRDTANTIKKWEQELKLTKNYDGIGVRYMVYRILGTYSIGCVSDISEDLKRGGKVCVDDLDGEHLETISYEQVEEILYFGSSLVEAVEAIAYAEG